MAEETDERWQDDTRRDGVAIRRGLVPDTFMVMPGAKGLPVVACPCCGKLLMTKRAAMLVADQLYPMEPGDAAT